MERETGGNSEEEVGSGFRVTLLRSSGQVSASVPFDKRHEASSYLIPRSSSLAAAFLY